MPAMAPTKRPPDDFDMAKLQKTLKQRQRQAVRNSANVARLSPAEIRSLNNSALASQAGSQPSTKATTSPSRSRRSTTTTPPASPDEPPAYQAQAHRNSISRNNSLNVPTPPHTPNGHRRSSQSSTHGHHHHHAHGLAHGHANGVIYAPRPRGSMQATFMSANGISSRPSSSGSSTYRGLPTYRGPEVTRTGSINMLQYPSQQIVNNPLSYFSRPRQSHVSTSPERSRHEAGEVSIYRAQSLRNTRANSLPYVSAPSSRQPSPPRVTDSPVSMMLDDTEKFPVFDPSDDPHNQPKIQSDEEDAQKEPVSEAVDSQPEAAPVEPLVPVVPVVPVVPPPQVEKPKEVTVPDSPKKVKDKQKRFTLHSAFFGGDKVKNENAEKKLKKARRRTLSSPTAEEAAISAGNQAAASEEKKSDGATDEDGDFSAHPAIRPLSLVIPGDVKGKDRAITSAPVYGRCACCGKIKRPHTFNNELSPVLENENLRTNFSFEIERTSGSSGRRSSDASRDKFIPIIPMQVGENETRQASIQPWSRESEPPSEEKHHQPIGEMEMEIAVSSPVRQPLRQKNASPVRMKRNSAPPRFVRFASLHGRRNGDTGPIEEEDEDLELEHDENQPLIPDQSDSHDPTIQTLDFATMSGAVATEDEIATSQPHLEISSAERAFIEPMPMVMNHSPAVAHESTAAAPERMSMESSSDIWHTPGRGLTPVVENETAPAISSRPVYYASVIEQPITHNPHSGIIDSDEGDGGSPISIEEGPLSTTSTTTTVTIVTPTSASTATSMATTVSSPSGWERELSATFLGPANSMDLSLRPRFSFESMHSAMNVADKGKGSDIPENATGKSKSMASGWGGGVIVKA